MPAEPSPWPDPADARGAAPVTRAPLTRADVLDLLLYHLMLGPAALDLLGPGRLAFPADRQAPAPGPASPRPGGVHQTASRMGLQRRGARTGRRPAVEQHRQDLRRVRRQPPHPEGRPGGHRRARQARRGADLRPADHRHLSAPGELGAVGDADRLPGAPSRRGDRRPAVATLPSHHRRAGPAQGSRGPAAGVADPVAARAGAAEDAGWRDHDGHRRAGKGQGAESPPSTDRRGWRATSERPRGWP